MPSPTTPTPKNILIAGAGVAGPALAHLLTNVGHKCTIVERAPAFRAAGQQIDIDGEAYKVSKRMGVYEEMRACRVEDAGLKFVTADDKVVSEFPVGTEGGLVKDLEIMRADVVRVIYERTQGKVEYVFDEYVKGVEQTESGVVVEFAKATEKRSYDILVAADGLRSKTRGLAFDASNTKLHSKGMYASFLSLPWQASDGTWSRWFTVGEGRTVMIRPNAKTGISSAYLSQVGDGASELGKGTLEEQKQRIIKLFKDVGWETQRVLREVEKPTSDFYGQEIAQAKSNSLSTGRVVLLGDAGYCPSPLSGQGTTLALIGSYVLAGCIATYPDASEAMAQYEALMRPFIERSQTLPPGVPWIVNPQSDLGIRVLNNVLWLAGKAVDSGIAATLGKVGGLMPSFGSKGPVLPDFPALGLDDTDTRE